MSLVAGVVLAVFGFILGRLLNLTIDRLPPEASASAAVKGCRSRHPFGPGHFIPVVSYFWWRRHCSSCTLPIPIRALLVEVVTAAACGVIGFWYGLTPAAGILIFYSALFIHLAVVDLEHSLLLNVVVLPAIPVALAVFPFSPLGEGWGLGEAYWRSLAGMGLGFTAMLLIYLLSRGGMGLGDVKLAALLGAILGFPQIIAGLALAYILGGVAGVVVLVLKLRRRNEAIPFGPALVVGTALVAFGGTAIYGWYLNLFR